MSERLLLSEQVKAVLKKARDTYGNKNQIMVCMEELCELACVLAKYPRYADEIKATIELHDKVLDEFADVMIILDHVQNIMGFSNEEVSTRIKNKVERVERWLDHSTSMQETIDDRKVDVIDKSEQNKKCVRCAYYGKLDDYIYENACCPCLKAQATEGKAPFFLEVSDK